MSQLDLARIRPAYNGSALAASIAPALWWGHILTATATEGPLAPLGVTAAALLVAGAAAWAMPIWPTRVLAFTPVTALIVSSPAIHGVLNFTTGAQL